MANTFSLHQSQLRKRKGQSNLMTERKPLYKKNRFTNMLKQNSNFFKCYVQKDISASISAFKLPNDPKKAVIIPIYKNSKLSKENYRPKSILPNISKVNERCLFDQISKYFETIFSKFQGGFCMGHSA